MALYQSAAFRNHQSVQFERQGDLSVPDHAGYSPEVSQADAVEFRGVLSELTPEQQQRFNAYLGDCVEAISLKTDTEEFGAKSADQPWADWLVSGARDSTVGHVLSEHISRVSALNADPEIQDVITDRKDWLSSTFVEKQKEGWFSDYVLEFAPHIQDAKVWLGDDLRDRRLRQKAALGRALEDRTGVLINQFLELNDAQASRGKAIQALQGITLPHELSHLYIANWLEPWLKETVVEDAARIVIDDEPPGSSLYPPLHSKEEDTGYFWRRRLRDAMLNEGSQKVDAQVYMRAGTSEGPNSIEVQEFDSALDASWGVPQARSYITNKLEAWQKYYHETNPHWSPAKVQDFAAYTTERELRQTPWKIFGRHYERPQLGAAALSGVKV